MKIIIEGTSLANTRNVAETMSTSPLLCDQFGYRRYSAVISAVWGNHDDFPWSKNMVDFEPSEIDQAMNKYRIWARLIELQSEYNWIIDRFHLSTGQFQREYNQHVCDFAWLEDWLQKLGFHLVLITQSSEEIISSMRNKKKPPSDIEIAKAIYRQNILRTFFDKSILPKLELDISNMNVQDVVEDIFDWWKSSSVSRPDDAPCTSKIFLPSCS